MNKGKLTVKQSPSPSFSNNSSKFFLSSSYLYAINSTHSRANRFLGLQRLHMNQNCVLKCSFRRDTDVRGQRFIDLRGRISGCGSTLCLCNNGVLRSSVAKGLQDRSSSFHNLHSIRGWSKNWNWFSQKC